MKSTYSSLHYDVFIGIDVDKKSYSFTVKDHTTMVTSKRIPSNPKQLYQYISKRYNGNRVLCAYESGPTGLALHDYLVSKNIECLLVSPFLIPKINRQKVKNNRIDSEQIAQHLKSGDVKPVRIPSHAYRELRHLVKLRENYARDRMTAKQRIKSLLLFESISVEEPSSTHWSHAYIEKLKTQSCSAATRAHMDMLIEDLEYARTHLAHVIKQLKAFCKEHNQIQQNIEYLESIPGIGFICATSILGKTGGPENWHTLQELASFAGLTPTEHSTGNTVNHGHITHNGDQTLRFLLIEAAWVSIRKDRELNQFYHRIKNKHHLRIGSKKAITAVARKLTQRIYRVLKDQRPYEIR